MNCFLTVNYKGFYIHSKYDENKNIVQVYFPCGKKYEGKSREYAKNLIRKYINEVKK